VKLRQLKGFGKCEEYEEPKLTRLINARCDAAKVTFGPYIKAIEQVVYSLPWFIKHVPVPDRPKLIEVTLAGYKYIWNNDYTSFEAHFKPELLRCCELQLYSFMLKNVSRGEDVTKLLHDVLAGNNKCRYDSISAAVEGVRMSGEMCTSLGNGFTNLMVVLFLANLKGFSCDGFVEGDDGIFGSDDGILTDKDFEEVGFLTKMEILDRPNIAKFCQLVYDRETLSVLPKIARVMRKFFWTHSPQKDGGNRTMRRLLRAKALSLAYEAPRCPVLRSLAKLGLRLSKGSTPLYTDEYSKPPDEREVLKVFELNEVAESARAVVVEQQGISIGAQITLEKWLDSINDYGKYDLPYPLYKAIDYAHYRRFVERYAPGVFAYRG
jgi:hypothetical protein